MIARLALAIVAWFTRGLVRLCVRPAYVFPGHCGYTRVWVVQVRTLITDGCVLDYLDRRDVYPLGIR